MAPTLAPEIQDAGLSDEIKAGMRLARAPPGDEICITGISGKFPDSDNMHQLRDNLFAKRNLVTTDSRRWDPDRVHPDTPKHSGKINVLNKFDASFFGIHSQQSHGLSPMARMLLEQSYEALVDAGVNPEELHGSRTGVIIGSCYCEFDPRIYKITSNEMGRSMLSSTRAAYTERIAYWLKLNGPCFGVDTACSSSLSALDHAYRAIRNGHCDQAIVAGVNLALFPNTMLQFHRLGVINPDGKCKTFDKDAAGYTRSEAVVVVYLQKAKDARRVYSTVVHGKCNNDGFKEEGITYPSGALQKQLLTEFYQECEIDPTSIAWVEAHGTGTAVGDPEECSALASVFCEGRDKPLPVGSIKSNMGHAEPSSGLCSVAKVIIAMETGLIPPNINFQNPKPSIPSLMDGRLQVITEPQPWDGGPVGVNSFGFGGANAHVCLKWNPKAKVDGGRPRDNLPRLVAISGRTEEGIERMFLDLESRPVDAELVALYHAVHSLEIPAHLFRGYAVLAADKSRHHVQRFEKRRPVWLVFPSATGEWHAAGKALLGLAPFASALSECHRALAPSGLHLGDIITAGTLDDPLHRVLAITAIQLGLLAVLRAVGVEPHGIVGVGSGELAAGCADECFTPEQAILAAHAYALSLLGEGRKDKEMASRSRSSAVLLKRLQQIITSPKARSGRLVSPSADPAPTASPEFLSRCLATPDQHVDVATLTPSDAVVVNFASFVTTPGSQASNAVDTLLVVLGKLFEAGANLRLANLYPPVEFPVSRGTPMISPLVGWNHTRDWYTDKHTYDDDLQARERTFEICTEIKSQAFYKGHVIDGRNLFPATGYLCLVLELQNSNKLMEKKFIFEDVRFHRSTNLPAKGEVQLLVAMQKVSGKFEVVEGGVPVVTGRCFVAPENAKEIELPKPKQLAKNGIDSIDMNSRDIYKELRLRGYDYTGVFRSLDSANSSGLRGKLRWIDDNWVAFMDNMLQMQILTSDTRGLFVPTSIDRVTIDKAKHLREVEAALAAAGEGQDAVLDVTVDKEVGIIRSGGIEIRGLNASAINRKKHLAEPVLEKHIFLPDKIGPSSEEQLALRDVLCACVHVGLDNMASLRVKAVELVDSDTRLDRGLLLPELARLLGDLPLVQADLCLVAATKEKTPEVDANIRVERRNLDDTDVGAAFLIASRLLQRADAVRAALTVVGVDGFIIARESPNQQATSDSQLEVLNEYIVGDVKIMLLRKRRSVGEPLVVAIREGVKGWVEEMQEAVAAAKKEQRVVLVSKGEPLTGLLGLFNCIRKEPGGQNARCFILDSEAPAFDPSLPLYRDRLAKDLAVNILRDGRWGSYRHLPLEGSDEVLVPHAYANVTTRGDLSSFRWLEGPIDPTSFEATPTQELVHVYSAALNFRDVMIATGRLAAEVVVKKRMEQDCVLGMEFAGRTATGRRVMGMVGSGAMSTLVVADSDLLWDVPDDWSLEDAATVPVVYGTALYALHQIGGMKSGDSVLIHAGSGGVGQAAIQLALHAGAVVFTTVGTPEKRAFVRQRFPQVLESHIGNSRDTSFEQLVLRETGGRGVDLVLNSLAEEKLQASLRCLAVGGRFLEIGKFDLAANNLISMELFLKETSFHGVMLDSLFFAPRAWKRKLRDLLTNNIRNGAVRPLTRTHFPAEDVEKAFRFMGAGKHIGKVLLSIRPEEAVKKVVPKLLSRTATPRFSCDPQRTYIIAGGLGGFGLELADWLVLRGARQMVLVSRSGLRTGYQAARVRTWRSYGVQVLVSTANIETEAGVSELLTKANKMAPVGGIFNLAVVLRDAMFENQSSASFAAVAGPKAVATRLLDVASRRLCPRLAHFVVFSSVSCGRGNAGQTSYGAANSVMERVCEQRVACGLPALAVQWGAVGQVGLVADMRDDDNEVVIGGTLPQRISSCLTVLDGFLRQQHAVVASMVVAEKIAAGSGATMVDCVAGILGIADMKTVSFQTTLAELGMDSMTAVEIKQTLEREYQVFLTPVEIRSLTLARVKELSEANAEAQQAEGTNVSPPKPAAMEMLVHSLGDESTAYLPTVVLESARSEGVPTVLMMPGIEGAAAVLAPLAAKLHARTVCVKGGVTNDLAETGQGIAESLLPFAKKELAKNRPFNLIGHSFGGLVTLHLAALLEKEGLRGTVTLVDGAPDLMKFYAKSCKLDGSEDTMQTNLLTNILDMVQEQNSDVLETMRAAILKLGSWSERLKYTVSLITNNRFSSRYLEDSSNFVLRRTRAALNFSWDGIPPLESQVTLLRPIYQNVDMPKDCGVGKFCRQPVEVHLFEASHTSILESVEVAAIINRHLLQ